MRTNDARLVVPISGDRSEWQERVRVDVQGSMGAAVVRELDGELSARDFVQSLERGLAVIEAFDADHRVLSLAEVARSTGLSRAAVRRFVLTLVELGYMRNDAGSFSLRPRVLGLGHAYLASLSLPEVARPHMTDLSGKLNQSVSLAVLDDDDIVYVAQVTASRPMAIKIDVGTRFPAYATAMGRVLLAAQNDDWLDSYLARVRLVKHTPFTVATADELLQRLQNIRQRGFAHVDRELDFTLRAVAMPIHNADRMVIAALATSTHDYDVDTAEDALLPPLEACVEQIEQEMTKIGARTSFGSR